MNPNPRTATAALERIKFETLIGNNGLLFCCWALEVPGRSFFLANVMKDLQWLPTACFFTGR